MDEMDNHPGISHMGRNQDRVQILGGQRTSVNFWGNCSFKKSFVFDRYLHLQQMAFSRLHLRNASVKEKLRPTKIRRLTNRE